MSDKRQEVILCAAILHKNYNNPTTNSPKNTNGLVLCGYRHTHIREQQKALGVNATDIEEGFLTSENRFVNRIEGAELFKEYDKEFNDFILTSDDLY